VETSGRWGEPPPGLQPGEICSDPSLGADLKGNFYLGYIIVGSANRRVVVARSTDGGQSFPRFSIPFQQGTGIEFADKPYLAADNQPRSRFRGRVYLGWTLLKFVTGGQGRDSFEYRIVAQTSSDGGSTWSAPAQISRTSIDPEVSQGSLPVVAPDGSAYIFYADSNRRTGVMSIRYSKSTDGGRSWGAPVEVAGGLPSPWFFTLRSVGSSSPGKGFRALSGPFAAITPAGKIFVAWIDFPNGSCQYSSSSLPVCTNSDLRMSVSGDGGLAWSAPVKVTNESGDSDQFFAWMAAHPDGLVSIAWADRRLDPENVKFDIFYTNTADGNVFLSNTRISSAASDAGSDGFIGDYNNLAASASGVVAVWTDIRSGPPHSIFSATGTLLP